MSAPTRTSLITAAHVLAAISMVPAEDWTNGEFSLHHAAFDVYREACNAHGCVDQDTTRSASQHALDLAMEPTYPGR